MRLLILASFSVCLLAQDRSDERFNSRLQALHRKERELVADWQADCRKRMAGGVLQQGADVIACVIPPPPPVQQIQNTVISPPHTIPPKPEPPTEMKRDKDGKAIIE